VPIEGLPKPTPSFGDAEGVDSASSLKQLQEFPNEIEQEYLADAALAKLSGGLTMTNRAQNLESKETGLVKTQGERAVGEGGARRTIVFSQRAFDPTLSP